MQRFRDVTVSSRDFDATKIVRYVESFAMAADGWQFPAKQSAEYSKLCGEPSCCLVYARGDLPKAALHLTVKRANALYVPNIIPLESTKLSVSEYNGIASSFGRELQVRARLDGVAIAVALSKRTVRLCDVVTSKVAWKLFHSYIGAFPLSHHPADVERLDRFICAVARYSRTSFDVHAFEYLLQEELGWPAEEAERCRMRVEIGLAVLTANRRF